MRAESFPAGSLTGARVCESVTVLEDTILEYNEQFGVFLSEESNKLVIEPGGNVTVITIVEDEDSELPCLTDFRNCCR